MYVIIINANIDAVYVNFLFYSFLSKFRKYPTSKIMIIISKFILEEQNALEIHKYLTYNLKSKVSYISITKVLIWIRRELAHYIKDIYRLYKLGKPNGESLINVNETLFIHLKGHKIWVLGAKNNETKKIRVDVFKTRTTEDCKIFITNHIRPLNKIITDGWPSFSFWMKIIVITVMRYMSWPVW